MSKIQEINQVMKKLSHRMLGQDVERHNNVEKMRAGGDFAAISQIRASRQGVTPLGLGR